ncbi:hypothetical protein KIK84_07335 [Curvibacter sp. CHRR-16]|uniref:hypothetical protein n=1 Tax=Curvibacter sp. CHRR-16 TaxID=2835872 RepID=UPI001BDA46B2|nr:hypothetical protein [Curvibacter sp. CHRR-16]MBT0570132.1 hypothetical protein [Curvibacter sp. CHRR-16]
MKALSLLLHYQFMRKDSIQVPEKGTYQWQLFDYWLDEFRNSHANHSAYIALNFAGVLDDCRSKLHTLLQKHRAQAAGAQAQRHQRAISRLQSTITGAAMEYESAYSTH